MPWSPKKPSLQPARWRAASPHRRAATDVWPGHAMEFMSSIYLRRSYGGVTAGDIEVRAQVQFLPDEIKPVEATFLRKSNPNVLISN
jgi:hypothetical protein